MTNGNEAHASGPEAAIAQASNDMIAETVQRHAEAEAAEREAEAAAEAELGDEELEI